MEKKFKDELLKLNEQWCRCRLNAYPLCCTFARCNSLRCYELVSNSIPQLIHRVKL
jgi:hypothetical protein